MGLPGSGKSTYVERLGETAISSDEIRRLISDDPTNQSIHRRVFGLLRELVRQRLELHRPVTFVDATNLTVSDRRPYIVLADLYDAEVEAVYFDVPVEECQRRNRERHRVVPEDAIQAMAGRLVRPSTDEGFLRVTVVKKD